MDPSPHSTPKELAELARTQPDQHALIAAHRAAYPALLTWIAENSPDLNARQLAAQRLASAPAPASAPTPRANPDAVSPAERRKASPPPRLNQPEGQHHEPVNQQHRPSPTGPDHPLPGPQTPAAPGYVQPTPTQPASRRPRGRRKLLGVIAAVAVIVLLAGGGFLFLGRGGSASGLPPFSLALDKAPAKITFPSSNFHLQAADPHKPYIIASEFDPEESYSTYFVLTIDGNNATVMAQAPEDGWPYDIVNGTVFMYSENLGYRVFTWDPATGERAPVESPDSGHVVASTPVTADHLIIVTAPESFIGPLPDYTVSSVNGGEVEWSHTKADLGCNISSGVSGLELVKNGLWLRCPSYESNDGLYSGVAINVETGAVIKAAVPEDGLPFIVTSADGAATGKVTRDGDSFSDWSDFAFYGVDGEPRNDIEIPAEVSDVAFDHNSSFTLSEWAEGMAATSEYSSEHPDAKAIYVGPDGTMYGATQGDTLTINGIDTGCVSSARIFGLADHGNKMLCWDLSGDESLEAFDISEGSAGASLWRIEEAGKWPEFIPFDGDRWLLDASDTYLLED